MHSGDISSSPWPVTGSEVGQGTGGGGEGPAPGSWERTSDFILQPIRRAWDWEETRPFQSSSLLTVLSINATLPLEGQQETAQDPCAHLHALVVGGQGGSRPSAPWENEKSKLTVPGPSHAVSPPFLGAGGASFVWGSLSAGQVIMLGGGKAKFRPHAHDIRDQCGA